MLGLSPCRDAKRVQLPQGRRGEGCTSCGAPATLPLPARLFPKPFMGRGLRSRTPAVPNMAGEVGCTCWPALEMGTAPPRPKGGPWAGRPGGVAHRTKGACLAKVPALQELLATSFSMSCLLISRLRGRLGVRLPQE